MNPALINWLLEGDVSVQYQVCRDLLGQHRPGLQQRIAREGWGKQFLSRRNANGHWGRGFYSPKWTSSHYTLLDLKHLQLPPENYEIQNTILKTLRENRGRDGGVNPARTIESSDVCVNGMFLNYACYFMTEEGMLTTIVDFLLSQQMPDGGFNCWSNRQGARHSSLHTSLSVMEGVREYHKQGYRYRLEEMRKAERESQSFVLEHRLFRSSRTGEIIDKKMLMLSWPSRWRYDILRTLDYFRDSGATCHPGMEDALEVLLKKRRPDGTWPLQARHSGHTHFEMEPPGEASRWNTLRALRVLKHFMKLPEASNS